MADLKISQLNSLAGGSLANNDVLAVVDTSASETKKITSKELVQYGYGLVDPNTLDGDVIEPGTTSARGTIQLTDSTSSTSTTTAATPNAVKGAYDLANAALPKAGGTMTGQILADDSTSASTPGYAFDGDPNTGLLRTGADEVALVTGGSSRLTIDASGNVVIPGNFTVSGTTTTIDTTTLVVEDKNIEMGVVATPTDVTADGGGITLKGTTDKTINWIDATDAWTSSERFSYPLGSAAAPALTFTGDPNTGIYSPGADQVAISTNGTGRLFVDASGRILSNVSSSTASVSLQLQGNGGNSSGAGVIHLNRGEVATSITTGEALGAVRFCDSDNNGSIEILAAAESSWSGTSIPGYLQINTAPSGSTTRQERLRLTSDGLLGLGTSSPKNTLHVNGYINVGNPTQNQTSNNLIIVDSQSDPVDTNKAAINLGTTAGASSSDSFISFFTNKYGVSRAERVRIDPEGRVGIGVNAPDPGGQGLHVHNASAADSSVRITNSTTGATNVDGFAIQVASDGTAKLRQFENVALTFETNATERARIDSSGRLLVGTSSALNEAQGIASLQVAGTGNGSSGISAFRYSADNQPARINLVKSRGASVGATTVVQSGDIIGRVTFNADNGSSFLEAAQIAAEVDGAVTGGGANDMPGRLVFSTTADGSSSPTERMRIAQNGVITIQNGAVAVIGTLTDGATITPDFAANCNSTVTLGGNRTIANPSNLTAGQSGSIFLVQDATGGRTAAWGSYWDFPGGTAPTLSTAANAVDRVDYIVRSSTSIHTVFTANYS